MNRPLIYTDLGRLIETLIVIKVYQLACPGLYCNSIYKIFEFFGYIASQGQKKH